MDAYNETARMRLPIDTRPLGRVKAHASAFLTLTLLSLLVGCHGGVDTDLLEREMRWQEDRIYELEDYLVDCQNVVRHYRNENQELRDQLGLKEGESPPTDNATQEEKSTTPAGPPPATAPDAIEPMLPTIEGEENGLSDVSKTDRPQHDSQGQLATPPMPMEGDGTGDETGVGTLGAEELPIPLSAEPSGPLDRIVLQKLLEVAQPPAPEGLFLRAVIEPRSPDGVPVRATGDISLMILDPQQPGPEGKIARWDYHGGEAISRWRRSGLGSGLHFDLPLPAGIENRTFELWARFVAADGEKYLASVEFEVNRQLADARSRPAPTPPRPAAPKAATADTEKTTTAERSRWSPSSTAAAIEKTAVARHDRYRTADAAPASPTEWQGLAPRWRPETPAATPQPPGEAERRPDWSPYR